MSDPRAAAERFVLSYFSGGEEHVSGRPSDDILALAAVDAEELAADGPGPAIIAMLHLLDVAVDFVAHLADADRTAVVRRIVAISEQRRAGA